MKKEAIGWIKKAAEGYLHFQREQEKSAVKVAEVVKVALSGMSDDDKLSIKEAEFAGRMMAIGMVMEKQASVSEEVIYQGVIDGVETVWGKEKAAALDKGLREYSEQNIDQVQAGILEEVKQIVTPIVVESQGGEEAVKAAIAEDPNKAGEIQALIDETSEVALNEVAQGIQSAELPVE